MVTDEEEVVRALLYLGKVGVTDLRDIGTKDMTEDLWRYACDVQQRVSGPFEPDDFRVQGQDGAVVDLAAHPGDLNALRLVLHTLEKSLTHVVFRVRPFFGQQTLHRGGKLNVTGALTPIATTRLLLVAAQRQVTGN